MPLSITAFKVTGLFGDTTISVPIQDNKLVIVGVNGLGKSTFLNLFCYFISQQWPKLLDYDFLSLTATINDDELTLTRDEIEQHIATRRQFQNDLKRFSPRMMRFIDRVEQDSAWAEKLLAELGTSPSTAALRRSNLSPVEYDWLSRVRSSAKPVDSDDNLEQVSKKLVASITAQVLYLPTYRRIEKDLGELFPGLEDELRMYHERRNSVRNKRVGPFIEFVEFGMEDVDRDIRSKVSELKEAARAELNNLAGGYLRDVIRGEGNSFDSKLLAGLTAEDVSEILNRVEEKTLNELDKNELRGVIQMIRDGGTLSEAQTYVAHFFTKLLLVGQKLRENEASVSRFAEVCNHYLDGKAVVYDEVSYEIKIRRVEDSKLIELKSLSSGEKQIVSLFAQVYLGPAEEYIIIIDEPELSLSVNWQKTLLPDLKKSEHCPVIFAVTHSPFVFDNEFNEYAVNLSDYVVVAS